MRSARTKERNRDFDFSDLFPIGYPRRNDVSSPLKGKGKKKSTTLPSPPENPSQCYSEALAEESL
jgi:hypothetical protein